LISGVAAGILSMSDPQNTPLNPNTLQGDPSPEELEAAQAANGADALAAAQPMSAPQQSGSSSGAPVRVALTNGDNRTDNVFRGLKSLEKEIARSIGDRRVVIKPNNVSLNNQLASSHADALAGILDFLKSIGKLDNVIIAAFAGTTAVAVYAIAFRLADYQRQLCNQFNGLLFPVVVRFSAADEVDSLRATLVDGTRIAFGLITGVTLCLVTFADRLVAVWMGPGFADSLPALYVLAAAGTVLVAAGPLGNLLLARGRHRVVAFSCLGEAVLNLVLSIWLVRRYGIVGAAVGTAVSVTISNVLVQMPAACRLLDMPIGAFLLTLQGVSKLIKDIVVVKQESA
jgi:hypothetical protein